jgi:streptomycin 6-kinase
MAPSPPILPDKVLRNLAARGAAGEAWLEGLPETLARLEGTWGIAAGAVYPIATEACVVAATLADGTEAALKIPIPGIAKGDRERRLLEAAGGRGYVRLYRHDPESGAMLLERLGPQLAQSGLDAEAQIVVICETLRSGWGPPPEGLGLPSGAAKAAEMTDVILALTKHAACSERAIDVALRFLERRALAFDPTSAVLGHGDAHAWNTLRVPGTDRYRFVDPDGYVIERAHDLSISLREGVNDFLAGDPVARGRERCALLSRLTGVDPEPIWEWGLAECLVNGLLYVEVGSHDHAAPFLKAAEAWAATGP